MPSVCTGAKLLKDMYRGTVTAPSTDPVDATQLDRLTAQSPAIRFEPATQIVPDICQTIHDRSTFAGTLAS
ncbi:hypothetical protein K0M31_007852, partial [Melipona bicolor]